jgi:tRNA pseudouridine32 synthase/23S rRNA pseudouridine746 synthase
VVIRETQRILAVDKPAGVPTIPDRFGSDSLHAQLQRDRNERLWVVHRLDREVSGVLVFARDAATHRALSMAFEEHRITKRYEALTEGQCADDATFRWENKLLRGKKRSYETPHGKTAITEAVCTAHRGDLLVWRLTPLTGRNHQLRVHLSQHGYPIVGDALYGSTRAWSAGIALRAVQIELPAIDDQPAETIVASGL